MDNKFMDYLITTEYDKEKNYTIIMNRINEKRKPYYIKTIAASVLFFIIAGLLGNGIYAKIQWNIQYKEYLNVDRGVTSLSVKESESSGNLVKIDDQYNYKNNIGLKIDNLFISDDELELDVFIDLSKIDNFRSDTLGFGYIIYDENNSIIGAYTRRGWEYSKFHSLKKCFSTNYFKKFMKEKNISYKEHDLAKLMNYNSCSEKLIESTNKIVTQRILISSENRKIPKSHKIYIRIFDLGYAVSDSKTLDYEDFELCKNEEWNYDIIIPDKIYSRDNLFLMVENTTSKAKITTASVSESRLIIEFNGFESTEEYNKFIESNDNDNFRLYLEDQNGNVINYSQNIGGYAPNEELTYKCYFDLNKNNFIENYYTLHYHENNTEYEVIIKK